MQIFKVGPKASSFSYQHETESVTLEYTILPSLWIKRSAGH